MPPGLRRRYLARSCGSSNLDWCATSVGPGERKVTTTAKLRAIGGACATRGGILRGKLKRYVARSAAFSKARRGHSVRIGNAERTLQRKSNRIPVGRCLWGGALGSSDFDRSDHIADSKREERDGYDNGRHAWSCSVLLIHAERLSHHDIRACLILLHERARPLPA